MERKIHVNLICYLTFLKGIYRFLIDSALHYLSFFYPCILILLLYHSFYWFLSISGKT